MKEDKVILEVRGITKSFPGVKALNKVNLVVRRGEVHGLTGENGAGKSTLMKILMGIYQPDSGEIIFQGKKVQIKDASHAKHLGINMVFQELNLFPHLSVMENIFVNREITRGKSGLLNWRKMYQETKDYFQKLKIDVDPLKKIRELNVANRQMVEITRAISTESKIIIMDEPTSSLSDYEIERLFEAVKLLKEEGISIIYISHKLEEVMGICDRVTVLRNGEVVANYEKEEMSVDNIIQAMLGKSLEKEFPKIEVPIGDELLKVEGLSLPPLFSNVTFTLRSGEILGFLGLVGSGRTDVAKAIFGMKKPTGGKIYLKGREVKIESPLDAIKSGIAYVSEDRKNEGLFLGRDLRENITIAGIDRILNRGFIDKSKENKVTEYFVKELDISTPSIFQRVKFLSGGNQQKVCLARWFFLNPSVIILDEPTRGIDVGAKTEIYQIIGKLAGQGKGIILISSETEEILGVSDRIIVFHEGEITGEFKRQEFSKRDSIMQCMMGVN